ncbi:MAG TPA: glycosyltransferase family 39 protein [Xanthobacteraceae bacterium]|nr:glycosyltransferase family 39 protein [Xanthobacteraceae bacterium]
MLLFWIVYGIAHATLRLSVSRTLTIDDARANELTQQFALGYQVRQPPLYEWILWSVQQVLGPGVESHLLVRYSLIALIGIATYGAVRAATRSERWAAAASLSLLFSYPVGWTFHEWATQTLLLCAACMFTVQAAVRFFERPGLRSAALLGLALAFGLYAKFSFPLMVAGLLLAALSIPETRRKLADVRLLISLAILAILFSPYALWVWQVQGDVVADLSGHLVNQQRSHFARAGYGLWRLLTSSVTFLLPWIAIVALLAPEAFVNPKADAAAPSLAERLAFRAMIFALAIAAVGIVFTGATNIAARYMHPMLFIAPVYVFARIARLAPVAAARNYAGLAMMFAVAILVIRFVGVTDNALTRSAERALLMPYERLGAAIAERGLDRGTIASVNVREAGNLRAAMPELRVTARDSLRVQRVPQGTDLPCSFIWMEGQERAARGVIGAAADKAEKIEIAAKPGGLFASRGGVWFLARLDPQSPACR